MKYSREHVWVKVDGDIAEMGLTNFKKGKMGKISFVDMPEEGDFLDSGDTLFSIEAVKAEEEFPSPLSGEIVECNEELSEDLDALNKDAESTFIVKMKLEDEEEVNELLTLEDYKKVCEE